MKWLLLLLASVLVSCATTKQIESSSETVTIREVEVPVLPTPFTVIAPMLPMVTPGNIEETPSRFLSANVKVGKVGRVKAILNTETSELALEIQPDSSTGKYSDTTSIKSTKITNTEQPGFFDKLGNVFIWVIGAVAVIVVVALVIFTRRFLK